jgi:hypothetical protein
VLRVTERSRNCAGDVLEAKAQTRLRAAVQALCATAPPSAALAKEHGILVR